MDDVDKKLNQVFPGRVVRKDLTKKLRKAQTYLFMCWNIC